MRKLAIAAVVFVAACNGNGPTAPTPPPIVNVPPVVVTPPPPPIIVPPTPPPPAFPPNDPRFNMTFYRQFVHNELERPEQLQPLRRQTQAPRIYLRTVDEAGAPMDVMTLNQTASALENVAGSLTGVFGLAALERGTETRQGQAGWITVRWSAVPELINEGRSSVCGRAAVGGDLITLYPRSPGCRCPGGPAVVLSTVKHELGHSLGFWHTDAREDLMYRSLSSCDHNPSEREKYHAAIAYTRQIGTFP